MGIRILANSGLAVVLALAFAACGGGGSPTSPDGGSSGNDGPIAATIVIDATGNVTPKDVTVPVGSRVTFTNNHTAAHQMASDPHPEHTDCREINSVGVLQPGRSAETGNLNTVRACGFHDHLQDQVASMRGTITIR